MNDPLEPQYCDELLQPFLSEPDDSNAQGILSQLIENRVIPLIKGVLRQKLSSWGNYANCIDDIQSEVLVRLLSRLQQLKKNPKENPIWNFREYVASTTSRVCNTYLRSQYPNRSRLKNTLMYLLTRDQAFFLSQEEGKRMCGLAEWLKSNVLMDVRDEDEIISASSTIRAKLKTGYQDAPSLRLALNELFLISQAPLELDEVVKIMVAVFSVQDLPQKSVSLGEIFDILPDQKNDPEKTAETLQFLKNVWNEIGKLPVKQRVALLLNLKDSEGKDLLSLFPVTGVTTFRQIASILELPLEEFVEIWKEIPLGDSRIGELLGVPRQQVINLRKSAKERLMRRSK